MAIFRLEVKDDNLHNAELVVAKETDIKLESHLESWLENSPWALVQEEPILWIDRQTSANVEESTIFPDLLGLDSEGNLVIVELKRSKAPREVVAQLLEYAAWAKELSDEQIQEIAVTYFQTTQKETTLQDAFSETFEVEDEMPALNRRVRLFIVAAEIPASVLRVSRFLRTFHSMDINCLAVSTFQTESGEVLVDTEAKVGQEDIAASKAGRQNVSSTSRWSGDKPVREVVLEAVQELTKKDTKVEFTHKEVYLIILKKYPDFKAATVRGQLTAGCPNHASYRHHPGNYKYYWWIRPGIYRLYDPKRDMVENTEAKVGDEDIVAPKAAKQNASSIARWSGNQPVREVVLETVQELTGGDINVEFSPKEVSTLISNKYPDFKLSNVGPELAAGCPNLPSYRHHSGNHKFYWRVRPGIYRLYDPKRDKVET